MYRFIVFPFFLKYVSDEGRIYDEFLLSAH
jgi:hypothetical protein